MEPVSYSFEVTNGTRQGAVFSPRGGFNSYLDVLIKNLKDSGHGAQLGLVWYGALFWADDGILLSTSVQGLQALVDVCQSHAEASDLMFSTDANPRLSKTFCIGFNCQNTENLATIRLNGDPLPWKQVVNHVGTKLHSSGSMETDMREKRARFIQSAVELNQEFESLEPESQLRMLRLYNMHFSGSNCFDF